VETLLILVVLADMLVSGCALLVSVHGRLWQLLQPQVQFVARVKE
jgi:hypothetical protein